MADPVVAPVVAPAVGGAPGAVSATAPVVPAVVAPAAGAPAAAVAADEADLIAVPEAKPAEPVKPAVVADLVVKPPEGVPADDALLAQFVPVAKEMGLDSPKAQKLVDLYAGAVKANAEKADAAFVAQQKAWHNEIKSDKDLGGQNLAQTRVDVKRFFDAFDGDGSIRKQIGALGLSSHPALVRLAVRAAAVLREDSSAVKTAGDGGAKSDDEILAARYPTMYPKP